MSNTADPLEQVIQDIKAWDTIADHRTGSSGDQATDAWLSQEIVRAGADPQLEPFTFARLDVRRATLEVDGATLHGVPMFDGGTTGPDGICGRFGNEIGCLVCAPFDNHPATEAFQRERRAARHAALIALSAANGVEPGLALLNAESFRTPSGPPVLQVSSLHRRLLDDAMQRGLDARITIDAQRKATSAANVVCVIPGLDDSAAPAVIMTPKSAWWTCTAERIGGICVWLALLRHFAQNPPKRRLIFTATSGHELSHLGLDAFIERYREAEPAIWLHLGANFASKGSQIRLQASSDHLMNALHQHLSDVGMNRLVQTPVATRPAGEARNVFDLGGDFYSILGSNRWFHQAEDRWPKTVDEARTTAIVHAVVRLMTKQVNA